MRLEQLQGRQVLVTGAGSGIGRATALAFAQRGAHVVVSDIDQAALAAVEREVVQCGVSCLARAVDVADGEAMRAFAADVQTQVGAVDVLVNNAGIGYLGPFVASPLASWRRALDVNVMGVVHGCYHFLPAMIEAGGPRRVVNVASLAGIAPAPTMSAYAASKFAVMGLTDVLALELHGTGVGVTAVCPGIIDTPITANDAAVSPAVPRAQLERLRTWYRAHGAPPEQVAEAIVDAVRRGRPLVLVGPMARLGYLMRRLSSSLLRRLTLRDARAVGYLP